MENYRIIPLSAADADRLTATEVLVWFHDRPGVSPQEFVETLDPQMIWGVEYTGPEPVALPEPRPLAGTFASWDMDLTVPGPGEKVRRVPMDALTWVGVHPDHRRRGLLRSMISHQVHRVREQGRAALAGLHASEPGIYGRFGYAVASLDVTLALNKGTTLAAPEHIARSAEGISTRLLPASQSADLIQQVHRATTAATLGAVARRDAQGDTWWIDHAVERGSKEPLLVLLAQRDQAPVGYAILRRQSKWSDQELPAGKVQVWEMAATDSPALLALGRRLVDFDLTATAELPNRTLDDPLLWWAGGPRAAGVRAGDSLWLRIVDLAAALTQRGYAAPCDVVLDVTDQMCAPNAGRWHLQVGADGTGRCRRTDDDAHLRLDVSDLAAAYLGNRSIAGQAAAGYVTEVCPGAVAELSRAMRTDTAPYGALMF
ncbi:GNAT family N-acetyltransferase [Pseudactinotalea sp. Z1739]|uniref:GNAT family N-acetyltransferase n=1 Tax=Pseudactinotalea sp. Z1739 TaxID=3413028 RepID=UPI003C79A646